MPLQKLALWTSGFLGNPPTPGCVLCSTACSRPCQAEGQGEALLMMEKFSLIKLPSEWLGAPHQCRLGLRWSPPPGQTPDLSSVVLPWRPGERESQKSHLWDFRFIPRGGCRRVVSKNRTSWLCPHNAALCPLAWGPRRVAQLLWAPPILGPLAGDRTDPAKQRETSSGLAPWLSNSSCLGLAPSSLIRSNYS